jgi:prepilin-type processing-associated H-X9-DG protein
VRGYWKTDQDKMLRATEPWHGAMNNYLFCDGHVRTMKPDLREGETPTRGNNRWYAQKDR